VLTKEEGLAVFRLSEAKRINLEWHRHGVQNRLQEAGRPDRSRIWSNSVMVKRSSAHTSTVYWPAACGLLCIGCRPSRVPEVPVLPAQQQIFVAITYETWLFGYFALFQAHVLC